MKKLLAMVLALVMTMSLVTISSNAAFADADKIEHDEAVETLSALGVIAGMGDGNFAPEGNVTRSQMAKMITVIMLGDVNVEAFKGITTDLTDINDWAEAYVKYCYSQGIIAGKGNGMFDGNANVTTAEAAKMLLVAIGYNSDVQGYTGAQWQINVTRDAQLSGFFKDVVAGANKALTRDEAAQMIFNAVKANGITKTPTLTVGTNEISYTYNPNGPTLLAKTFGMREAEGYLVTASYDKVKKQFTYVVDPDGVTPNVDTNDVTIRTATDFSALLGLKVNALYKVEDGKNVAYGMNLKCATVSATVGELDIGDSATDGKIKLADVEYKVNGGNEGNIDVYGYATGNMADTTKNLDAITADKASTLTLVDTNDDGKYDYAVVAPVSVAKVTYVGAKGITAGGAYTYEDDEIVSGLAKGDFVTIAIAAQNVYNTNKIEKIDTVSGKVTGLNGTKVMVDGKWYKCAMNNGDAVALNKEFTLAVIGGYYYNATVANDDASLENLVLAVDKGTVSMGLQQTKVMKTDGATEVIGVSKVGGNAVAAITNEVAPDTLYTYKIKDGAYELTAVSASNDLGYTFVANDGAIVAKTTTAAAKTTTSGILFADDAVVFVKNTDDSTKVTRKVITGTAVNDWAADYGDSSVVLYKTNNGVKYAAVAFVVEGSGTVPAAAGEVGNYGYVVSNPYQIKEDDDTFDTYEVWNGKEVVTVKDEDADLAIKKGDIISYTDLGNGEIKDSAKVGGPIAITGFTDKLLQGVVADGTPITNNAIDKDTVILYVDSKDVKGAEGGEFALAAIQPDGSRIMNAWFVGSSGTADLIVYEVNNDIEALANDGAGRAGLTVGTVSITGSATNCTDTLAITKDLTYAVAGDKITVTVKAGADGTVVSSDGVTLKIDENLYATIDDGTYTANATMATFTFTVANGNAITFTIGNNN